MDWIKLFEDNQVPYVTRGPNTRRGEISIRCPFCGEDDPSEHMGIVLDREAWGCHRNQQHRGKSPVKLVQAILGCSFAQAKLIVPQYNQADPEALDQAVLGLGTPAEPVKQPQVPLTLPPEFKPISGRFYQYLKGRGFEDPYELADYYGLKCCNTGRWKDRIIIPIYQKGKLIAWTARAIQQPKKAPRYLSTSEAIKTTVFNEDDIIEGGDTLIVTEGPFDALKVDYYGYPEGIRATAVFGTSITIDQISILKDMYGRYRRVILLFDQGTTETAFNISEWLPGARIGSLPQGVKDPGDLDKNQIKTFLAEICCN